MKIKLKKSDLLSVVSKCVNYVDKKPILPILGMFKINFGSDRLYVMASDNRSWIISSCPYTVEKMDDSEPRSICVPAIKMFLIVSSIHDENDEMIISLRSTKGELTKIIISSGGGKHELPIASAEEFPLTQEVKSEKEFRAKGAIVIGMFRNVSKLVGDEGYRAQLEGMMLEYDEQNKLMKLSGGNAIRLAMVSTYAGNGMDLSGWNKALIHHGAVRKAEKMFEAHSEMVLKSDGERFSMSDGVTSIVSRVIDEKFPNMWALYDKLPKQANIKMSTAELVYAISQAKIHRSEINEICQFVIGSDSVKLTMEDMDGATSSETLIHTASGNFKEATIGVHIIGLKDAIEATNSYSVEMVYGEVNGRQGNLIFNVVDSEDPRYDTRVLLGVYRTA